MFDAASDVFCGYALDTGTFTESADGDTAATLAAAPTTFALVGQTQTTPDIRRGLNNSKGYGIGAAGALYNRRSGRTPTLSVDFAPGSLGLLSNCLRDETTPLPYLCFWVGVKGKWTLLYRKMKCNTIAFNFRENAGGGEGGELRVQASFMGLVPPIRLTTPLTPAASLTRALGTPLLWHDLREAKLTDSTGAVTDLRQGKLMGFSATVNHNLENKGARNNWGDNSPLSLTPFNLLEHHITASGELSLHDKLAEALFTGSLVAQDWGNIVTRVSDAPVVGSGSGKAFTLTATNCLPGDETMAGVQSSAQLGYGVPFSADNLILT